MLTVALPSFWLQLDPLLELVTTSGLGSVIVEDPLIVQPFASVTMTS